MPYNPSRYSMVPMPTPQPIDIAGNLADFARMAASGQQLEARKKDQAAEKTANAILPMALVKNKDGVSTWDRDVVTREFSTAGIGHLLPTVLANLDKADASALGLQEARKKHAKEGFTALAENADLLGSTPQSVQAMAQHGVANGFITQDEAQQYLDNIGDDPVKSKALVDKILKREPPKLTQRNPANDLVDEKGNVIVKGTPAVVKKTYEQKTVTLDGKPNQLVNYDSSSGESFLPGSTEPIDTKRMVSNPAASIQIHNMGGSDWEGDWEKTGEDFLPTIPAQWRATVKKIAAYEEDPTKVASMRGGNREKLTAWVNQLNPAYDAGLFTNRAPTRKAFTTGTQGQQITAMNTAVEHLDQLQAAADALANGSFKPGNRAYNYLRDTFGSAMPSNYDTIKNMVDKEVEAVANKGVPTVSGTAEQKALAGTAASPESIKGYIDTLIPLMGSKLNALDYSYRQAMGQDDPFQPVTPQAKAILEKRGFNAKAQKPGGEPAASAGITINAPSGKAYTFKTQAEADAAVAAAKAKGLWK